MKKTIVMAAMLMLAGCSNVVDDIVDDIDDIDEDKIYVFTDGQGSYTCNYGSVRASREFSSFDEAKEYCDDWKNRHEKRMNKKWMPAEK